MESSEHIGHYLLTSTVRESSRRSTDIIMLMLQIVSGSVFMVLVGCSDQFWLTTGFTDRLLDPKEDFTLPETYGLGLVGYFITPVKCLIDRPILLTGLRQRCGQY